MTRRRLLIAGGIIALLSISSLVLWKSIPRIGAWYVRTRTLPRLAKRLGRDLTVKAIHVTRGRLVLDDVTISGPRDAPDAPLFHCAQISVDFDFWKAVKGDLRLGVLEVVRPQWALVRAADGTDNWRDALDRLRHPSGGGKKTPARRGPIEIIVTQGSLRYEDDQIGVRFGVEDLTGDAKPKGPMHVELSRLSGKSGFGPGATADKLTFDADLSDLEGTASIDVVGGTASLTKRLSLTGIHGKIAPGASGQAKIDLHGGYGGADAELWQAEGSLDALRHEGDLHVRADKFSLDKIAPILRGSHIKSPENATVGAALDVSIHGGQATFTGGFEVAGLTVFHPYIAEKPLENLAMKGTIRGRYDHHARLFELDSASVQFRGVEAVLEGFAAMKGGHDDAGVRRAAPHLRAHLVVPEVPCQTALGAIPPELAPRLQGFKLAGKFTTDLIVDINWADLDALELGGSVGIMKCKVLHAPQGVDTKRLSGDEDHQEFTQISLVGKNDKGKDEYLKYVVGPSNPDYVPLDQISQNMVKAVFTTEDGGFYYHKGFIVSEFRSALIKNLKAKSFVVGASSITMQFVKNVLLYREKTLSRKLQELFLTWYVEQTLAKDRILEIYLNVIEFGPRIYGIGPAAHAYFGKPAKDLSIVDAAFFSTLLPSPKRRYLQYCDDKLYAWTEAKMKRIIQLELDHKKITQEEFDQAVNVDLPAFKFVHPEPYEKEDKDKCTKDTKKLIKNSGTTMPDVPEEDPDPIE